MIEKYRSCLVIIMHLRGKILWCINDYVGIFGNTSYGCLLLRLTSTHCSWPCGGPLFVFLYFFRCEWVFAGICFWYFPLPAGALDLRPWPFCRPGRKLTGPGTDPGTMQTTSNSALIYCFCPNYLFILLYFFIPDICHGRHRRRPCKFFLAGVIFFRCNAKNWRKLAFFGANFSVNWQKLVFLVQILV